MKGWAVITIQFEGYLRKLRKDKGLTLEKLADLTGLSRSYLSQLERGERGTDGIPSPEILKQLHEPLGVGYLELMTAAGHLEERTFLEKLTLDQRAVERENAIIYVVMKDIENLKENLDKNDIHDKEEIKRLSEKLSKLKYDETANNKKLSSIRRQIHEFEKHEYDNLNIIMDTATHMTTKSEILKKTWDIYFNVTHTKTTSEEDAKQRFLSLENLLTMDENIYFNKKALTTYQRQQLLNIAEIIFNVENEDNNKE